MMLDPTLLLIAAAFLLAGMVKGVIGLGLPTISMGLLAVVMSPVQAAAVLLLPSFVTNIWQMLAGPALGRIARRLWPMLVAVCVGTWCGLGLLSGSGRGLGSALLGGALIVYAVVGLTNIRLAVARDTEVLAGPVVGALTGLVTAATGVFVIPAVPYLQAIGLEKEELVQALGLSFTVSTLALAVNVHQAGALGSAMAAPALAALVAAGLGMAIGQSIRHKLSPAVFRRWFFIALLVLGLYLLGRASLGV